MTYIATHDKGQKLKNAPYTIELRLSPVALGIAPQQLAGLIGAEKAARLRRACAELLVMADEIEGGVS